MKIQWLMAALLMMAGTGCTHISLKRLDQDIPTELVKTYNSNTNEYVDTGVRYFPIPYLSGNEYVAKTARGFQAYQHRNYGLLLVDTKKEASFDPNGQLLQYNAAGSFLTRMIYSEKNEKKRIGGELKEGSSKKILLGCLGTETTVNDNVFLIVLWVPCPVIVNSPNY